jgi:phthiodiolone/phenolphthiodiolone dimycocerosates ketoreductase
VVSNEGKSMPGRQWQVGVVLPDSLPFSAAAAAAAVAEEAGADSVWLTDHLLGIVHPALAAQQACGEPSRSAQLADPMCVGAALAARTTLSIGLAVTDGIRRGPADVARSAFTLSHLASGGFNLGVGAGEAMNLLPFGYPFDGPVGRLSSFLRDLRTMLDAGAANPGHGTAGVPAEQSRDPRLWVAGHGPRMLRLTGEYADGWIPAWPMSPTEYGDKRDVVAASAFAAGRPAPESGLFANVLVGNSREAVLAALDGDPLVKLRALAAPGWLWEKHGVEHPGGDSSRGYIDLLVHQLDVATLRDLAPRIPAALLAEWWFVGSVEDVVDRIGSYRRAGCEHVVLADASHTLAAGAPGFAATAKQGFVDLITTLTAASIVDVDGTQPGLLETESRSA